MEPNTTDSKDWDAIARRAYSAFTQKTNNKNYQGYLMPQWDLLPTVIQQAWMAASREAVRVAGGPENKAPYAVPQQVPHIIE